MQKGFSMFEVLISLVIISVTLLGFIEAETTIYLKVLAIHEKILAQYTVKKEKI